MQIPLPFPPGFAGPLATDERTCLVTAAHALYTQRGLAAVSMADLADHLGLPLDTVHKWFPAKELLVRAVVDALANLLYQALHQQKERSNKAVEEPVALGKWASNELRAGYATLFQQVEAAFPLAWQRWQEHTAIPLAHLRSNFRWNVLQDHYYLHLDDERQVERWFLQLSAAGFTAVVLPHILLEELLAGIVTPAGTLAVQRLAGLPA